MIGKKRRHKREIRTYRLERDPRKIQKFTKA